MPGKRRPPKAGTLGRPGLSQWLVPILGSHARSVLGLVQASIIKPVPACLSRQYLAARAGALNHDLTRVRPIDASQVTGDEVVIGSRVRLITDAGNEWTITVLGPWESEPEEHVLSAESEIAQRIIGLKVGDTVQLAGDFFHVESIEPYS